MSMIRSNLDTCYHAWRSVCHCDIMTGDSTKRLRVQQLNDLYNLLTSKEKDELICMINHATYTVNYLRYLGVNIDLCNRYLAAYKYEEYNNSITFNVLCTANIDITLEKLVKLYKESRKYKASDYEENGIVYNDVLISDATIWYEKEFIKNLNQAQVRIGNNITTACLIVVEDEFEI